jgi:hypothetical protein
MRKILFAAIMLLTLTSVAFAQTTATVRASWTAPTDGSPVDHYILQVSTNGGAFVTEQDNIQTTTTTLELTYMNIYVVRVAGVDGMGRQGPWSAPSDEYMPDLGIPTAPGKPVISEE